MDASGAPLTAQVVGLPATEIAARVRAGQLSAVEVALPAAVQFVSRAGGETRLLWMAEELERRQPWRRYAPVFDPTAPAAAAPV